MKNNLEIICDYIKTLTETAEKYKFTTYEHNTGKPVPENSKTYFFPMNKDINFKLYDISFNNDYTVKIEMTIKDMFNVYLYYSFTTDELHYFNNEKLYRIDEIQQEAFNNYFNQFLQIINLNNRSLQTYKKYEHFLDPSIGATGKRIPGSYDQIVVNQNSTDPINKILVK